MERERALSVRTNQKKQQGAPLVAESDNHQSDTEGDKKPTVLPFRSINQASLVVKIVLGYSGENRRAVHGQDKPHSQHYF